LFVQSEQEPEEYYKIAKTCLAEDGVLWISWPKKTSSIESSIDKYGIMKYGLFGGLVDEKVISINGN
jgi:hypothetical protein